MTPEAKLSYVKTILGIPSTDTQYNTALTTYITIAGQEILNYRYGGTEEAVPTADELVQLHAVATAFAHEGAPDEISHNENGISRTWKHEDMVSYIRSHLPGYVKLV